MFYLRHLVQYLLQQIHWKNTTYQILLFTQCVSSSKKIKMTIFYFLEIGTMIENGTNYYFNFMYNLFISGHKAIPKMLYNLLINCFSKRPWPPLLLLSPNFSLRLFCINFKIKSMHTSSSTNVPGQTRAKRIDG